MKKLVKLVLSWTFFLGEVSTFSNEFHKQIEARSVNMHPEKLGQSVYRFVLFRIRFEIYDSFGQYVSTDLLHDFQRHIQPATGAISYQRTTHPAFTHQNFENDRQKV